MLVAPHLVQERLMGLFKVKLETDVFGSCLRFHYIHGVLSRVKNTKVSIVELKDVVLKLGLV